MNLTKLLIKLRTRFTMSESERSMEGVPISVSVIHEPPYMSVMRSPDGKIKGIEGYLADIWFILEQHLKFRTRLQDATSGVVGRNNNGTWNGMMGDLQSNITDVGLLNFGINLERKRAVDFSATIDYDRSMLLQYSSKGMRENIDWLIYTTTLSWDVWCCVGALWIATSLFLGYVNSRNSDISYMHYLFMMFGTLACQGSEVEPRGYKGRLIFIAFLAMCVIVYESYTALLTTHFTTTSETTLSSLKDILGSGYRISVINGSLQHQALLEGGSDEFDKINKMLTDNPQLLVKNYEKGIESTYDEKTLFLYYANVLQILLPNCSFSIQAPTLFAGYHHLAFRKGFKYKEALDRGIIKIISSGITKKLALKWLTAQGACQRFSDEVPSLSIKKTFFAFLVAIAGIAISLIILVFELIFGSIQNKPQKTTTLNWFMNRTVVRPINEQESREKELRARGFAY